MDQGRRYLRPPVNEVAITVSLADVGLFDPFNVESLYDVLSADFPNVERAEPLAGIDYEQFIGLSPLTEHSHLSRWWFISEDQSDLVQIQDNLLARNWRRLVGIDEPAHYPGYVAIRDSFVRILAAIEDWHASRGTSMPKPRAIELMYDDVIGAPAGHAKALLGSVLNHVRSEVRPSDDTEREFVPMGNWQNAWLERIKIGDSEATLSVQIIAAALPEEGAEYPRPVIRILWRASMLITDWKEITAFLDKAHDYIIHRFNLIVSDEAKARWELVA